MRKPFREALRKARLAHYFGRTGGKFEFHGIAVDIPDRVNFAIKKQVMRGSYEEPERVLIERYINPDLPVVELGGSLGIISAFVNARLSPGVHYLIVEGNGDIIDTCRDNARSTRPHGPLTVLHAACAYGSDSVNFTRSTNTLGNRIEYHTIENSVPVPARTLSSLVDEEAREGYTLIMDIEGGEFDVLEQDASAFDGCQLAIIEIHPDAFEARGRTESDFMALAEMARLKPVDRIADTLAFVPL